MTAPTQRGSILTMDASAAPRTAYVPITNRRRVASVVCVALLYLVVVLVLLRIGAPPPAPPLARERSVTVIQLPIDRPPDPVAPPKPEARAERPRALAPEAQPATVRPVPPLPAAVPIPQPAPPPPVAATGPITAGEGDAVYDLDAGGGGGAGFAPPRWVHKVTNDEFFPLVDEELLRASLEVDYRMQCTIALSTRVQCRVLKETPFYPGLRRAVLAAVPLLRMAPGKRDGRLIDGQRVEFLWRITVSRGDVVLR